MNRYQPHPSTIAYRAIEILKALPPGHTIATMPLAEKLGSDPNTVRMGLQTAVTRGLVARKRKDGLYHWCMGDGADLKPINGLDDDQDGAAAHSHAFSGVDMDASTKRRVAMMNTPFSAVTPPPEPVPSREPEPSPAAAPAPAPVIPTPVPAPVPSPAPAATDAPEPPMRNPDLFSFMWRSDGALIISKHGRSVTIDKVDAEKVRVFLECVKGLKL